MAGHFARDCRRGPRANREHQQQAWAQGREVRCFNCGRTGHIAMKCPRSALLGQGDSEKGHSSYFCSRSLQREQKKAPHRNTGQKRQGEFCCMRKVEGQRRDDTGYRLLANPGANVIIELCTL